MSYDLFLARSTGVTPDEFRTYFSQRPHYTTKGGQALYENQDTGVYFIFDLAVDAESEQPSHKVSFNLNFFRPHFFGREAAPELSAVIDAFGFAIRDPQRDGMGNGPFSDEAFIRGWDQGNAFGYRAILRSNTATGDVHFRPFAELDAIWRWNLQKALVQTTFSEDVFVPRIFWVIADGKLSSAAVWPDGVMELIPSVDLYFIGRDQLAPRRLFRRQPDTCVVARSALERVLGPFESGRYPLPFRLFNDRNELAGAHRFVKGLRRTKSKIINIPMDRVLDRELVDQALST